MYAFIIYVQCNLKMDGSEQKYQFLIDTHSNVLISVMNI